jgi:hypothetical protein
MWIASSPPRIPRKRSTEERMFSVRVETKIPKAIIHEQKDSERAITEKNLVESPRFDVMETTVKYAAKKRVMKT